MSKTILKASSTSFATADSTVAKTREDKLRDVALYHANLIQHRKDVEASILASIEILIDFPTSPIADPARPSAGNSASVKSSLVLFQPLDYDSLMEERNINRQCGYVLCPRNHRIEKTNAKYRLLHGAGKGPGSVKIVERQSLEKWCSDDCERRALYIRDQLSEEPAWTRVSATSKDIVLLEDKNCVHRTSEVINAVVDGLSTLDIKCSDWDEALGKMGSLAIEGSEM